jgi:hypothetical protein
MWDRTHELTHGWQWGSYGQRRPPDADVAEERVDPLANLYEDQSAQPAQTAPTRPPEEAQAFNYYNRQTELDARLAEMKRSYVAAHPGETVDSSEQAQKALDWSMQAQRARTGDSKGLGDIPMYQMQSKGSRGKLQDYMLKRMPGLVQNQPQQQGAAKAADFTKQAISMSRAYALAKRLGILTIPGTDWKFGAKMMAKAEGALAGQGLGRRMNPALAREIYLRRAGMATDAEVSGLRKAYERLRTHPEDLVNRAVRAGKSAPVPGQIAGHELFAITPRTGTKPIVGVGGRGEVSTDRLRGPAILAKHEKLQQESDRLLKLERHIVRNNRPEAVGAAVHQRRFNKLDALGDSQDYSRIDPVRLVHTHPLTAATSADIRRSKTQPWRLVVPSGVTANRGLHAAPMVGQRMTGSAVGKMPGPGQPVSAAKMRGEAWGADMSVMSTREPMHGNLPIIQPELGLMGATKIKTPVEGMGHGPRVNRFFVRQIQPFAGRMGEALEPRLANTTKFFKTSSADFTGELPDPNRFGDVTKLPQAKALRFVIQKHLAERAGTHYDVRMGNPELGLLSWAAKKEWPGPGGKLMLFQQPVHPYAYGDFQGTLPGGYGKGEVRTHSKGDVTVTAAEPGKLSFTVTRGGVPEQYTMIRRTGSPKAPRTRRQAQTQGGSWLLVNHTKQGSLITEVRRRAHGA